MFSIGAGDDARPHPDLRLAEPKAPPQVFPSLFVGGLTHLDAVWGT